MSNSSNTSLRDYLAERFPPEQFIPLPLMLLLASLASLAGGRGTSVVELALQFGLTLLWISQFRLWDDLHDRERDSRLHPHRVLVRTQSPAQFQWVAGLVSIGNLMATGLLLSWTIAFTLLAPLNLILGTLYCTGRFGRLTHAQIVLIRYPVFVLMLSGGATGFSVKLGLVMLLIYFTFAVYELLHDTSLRVEKMGKAVLFFNAFNLSLVWFLIAGWTAFTDPLAALILAGLAVGGCVLLFQLRLPGATSHHRIFSPAILQLTSLTFLS